MHRILVIEDNRDVRELMRAVLEGAGYIVEVASDGDSGIEAQYLQPADIVITDIFMPNRDGLETVERLRAEYPDVKVLVVSGGGWRGHASDYLSTAREIGANAVLAKPFGADALLDAVRGLLRHPVG